MRSLFPVIVTVLVCGIAADSLKDEVQNALGGRKLRVVTVEYEPYAMKSEDGKYTGYIPDLLEILGTRLGFLYEFYDSPDGRFGSYNGETGEWSGMIGELVKWEKTNGTEGADITGSALVLAATREAHIDFIKPFQHVGFTLLTKRPDRSAGAREFSVATPLSAPVWVTIAVATVVVWIALWGIYKISGMAGTVEDEEQFDLGGSIWFVFNSLNWQGYDRCPRPVGARLLGCVWFMFVTLTLVTYIGATVSHYDWATRGYVNPSSPYGVKNLAQVVADKSWAYGVVSPGQSDRFIKTGERDIYKVMLDYWATDDGAKHLATSIEEGLTKIRENDRYALILETMEAKLIANEECDLITMGEPFGMRSYGLAVPADHPMEEPLHAAILEMMMAGDLDDLEEKWFTGEGKCWREEAQHVVNDQIPVKQATMKMMAVPFGLIAVGVVMSLLLTVVDVLLVKRRGRGLSTGVYGIKPSAGDPDRI